MLSAAQCRRRWFFRRVYSPRREKTINIFSHIAANLGFNRHVSEVAYHGRLIRKVYLEPEIYYRAYKLYIRAQGEEGLRATRQTERVEKAIRRDMRDTTNIGYRTPDMELAALKALRERTYHN